MAIYMFGDYGGRDTPGYIPNPEVKSASAQDTWIKFQGKSVVAKLFLLSFFFNNVIIILFYCII